MAILKGKIGFKGESGYSPTVDVSKSDGVATITITDLEGTHTTTISDGEITEAMIVDNLTSSSSTAPLSAKQGKVLKDTIDGLPTVYSGPTEPSSD